MLLAAAAWLTKTIVSNRLTLDAEKFKTRLKADADVEIERLRSGLQRTAVEHQVRFAKLHEKRAEVIADLYNYLVEAQQAGERFVFVDGYAGPPERLEAYNSTGQKLRELYLFVEKNRIYLPEHVCTLLTNFMDPVRKTVIGVHVYASIEYPTQQTNEERNRVLMEAFQEFDGKIPAARRAVEEEFRGLLGVANLTSGQP